MMYCGELHSTSELVIHVVASDRAIWQIDFGRHRADQGCRPNHAHPLVRQALRQLREYFAGRRQDFDLPLETGGTPFQERVWRALLKIPYGKTRSYAEIARAIRAPKAVRAVGTANGSNMLPIVVPCHRVISTGGGLGGYGGGLAVKRLLLELESHAAGDRKTTARS